MMSAPVRSAASPSGPPPDPSDPLTFRNPVLRGFNPDPTICVVPASGDSPTTYFLSTSTFEFFPGCAIYSSTDLLSWELIGHALNRRSQIELRTVEPGAGSWASTLRYRAGEKRWYLANCLFQRYRPATDVSDGAVHCGKIVAHSSLLYRSASSLEVSMSSQTISGMTTPGLIPFILTTLALIKT